MKCSSLRSGSPGRGRRDLAALGRGHDDRLGGLNRVVPGSLGAHSPGGEELADQAADAEPKAEASGPDQQGRNEHPRALIVVEQRPVPVGAGDAPGNEESDDSAYPGEPRPIAWMVWTSWHDHGRFRGESNDDIVVGHRGGNRGGLGVRGGRRGGCLVVHVLVEHRGRRPIEDEAELASFLSDVRFLTVETVVAIGVHLSTEPAGKLGVGLSCLVLALHSCALSREAVCLGLQLVISLPDGIGHQFVDASLHLVQLFEPGDAVGGHGWSPSIETVLYAQCRMHHGF